MLKGNKTLVRSIVLGVIALFLSIFISKRLSAPKKVETPKSSFRDAVVPVVPTSWEINQARVASSGRVKAMNRMELFAEVNGVLLNNNFRAGQSFSKGQVIAEIDQQEFVAQLKSQRSAFLGLLSQVLPDISVDFQEEFESWNRFAAGIEIEKSLPALPELNKPKLKAFLSGRNVLNQYYAIKSQEVRLTKYRIVAPYNGVLSEVNIQPGTLVRSGQRLGLFLDPNTYELEAAVSESQLERFKVGLNVTLKTETGEPLYGQVSRVNAAVNTQTQLVNVYLTLKGRNIREGQYVQFAAGGETIAKSMKIPRTWLSERNTVFAVKQTDSTLFELPVVVNAIEKDQAIISGFDEGIWMLKRSVSGAFEGMKVVPQLPSKK